ncbi:Oidioi.mRNA.OKI2018_I69.PAR.g9043.t1.cds [Oikopleura dioica]|uniref:Oidioi.mRNA.OKI2018_I69.PAR.g9043.t1.cds n=1 Tax=Oikopleura dioica TaxID=34765 RepID=A0ABN7RMD9_OIKDI|nr:Oidioi.mRNA.OKI2018_I69.PAR.g9043.t1.cds [Oikopleura dioica]
MKILEIFYLLICPTEGNILEGINENIIRPVQKAIFGEISDSNSTIFIENGSIRNSNRQIGSYSNRNNLKIDTYENLEIVVVRDNIGFIEITNNLPKIEVDEDYTVDEALFYNITDVDEDILLEILQKIEHVQIKRSNLSGFSDSFINKLLKFSIFNLKIRNSWWSCDCTKKRLLSLRDVLTGLDVKCLVPNNLEDESFYDLEEDDLKCKGTNTPRPINRDVSSIEYERAELRCAASGYPLPKIYWKTPGGKMIDQEFLINASKNESLKEYTEVFEVKEQVTDRIIPNHSHLLSTLIVRDVNKRTAGEYRCQVGNIIDLLDNEDENINSSVPFSFKDLNKAKSTKVRLSYLPNEKANVAFFTLVLTCFIAAFVINLVNICRYHCDWKKRIKNLRQDPNRYEIPESIRTSMASVYYEKYDFTCQQAFLDALLKSSHSIKKTFENTTQGFEINVSYREFSDKLRENFGGNIEWRPSIPSVRLPNLPNFYGSLSSLRERIPNLPKGLRPSMNLSNLRWETGDWNMKVRISKFSRKWFYGSSENPSNIDEFQIRNENGRMVITPIPEKKSTENRLNRENSLSIDDSAFEASSSLTHGSSSPAGMDEVDADYLLTFIATPKEKSVGDHLYESNV